VTTASWRTTGEAEHAMFGLTGMVSHPDLVLATHFVGGAVIVTAQADGPVQVHGSTVDSDLDPDHLAGLHAGRHSGRLFHFPGAGDLVGRMTVAALLARSVVDDVVMVGQLATLDVDAMLDTQGFVRPHFVDGRVVLAVRPAADGVIVPFEQRHPTPCCAEH